MDEQTANEIRVLKQENESLRVEVGFLKATVDIILKTVETLEDKMAPPEEQEYVPAKQFNDPAVV